VSRERRISADIETDVKPFRQAPITIGVPSKAGDYLQDGIRRWFFLNIHIKLFGIKLTLHKEEGEHSLPLP
jgi:hypothetical protein